MDSEELKKLKMHVKAGNFEYEGVWFPPITTPKVLQQLKDFEVRKDDLILATYPKCGTHWMSELLNLMLVDGHPEKIERHLDEPHGALEFGVPPHFNASMQDLIAKHASPRYYVTHLMADLLPPQVWTVKPKIVYVTREPKDACTSMYRFTNAAPIGEQFSWETLFEDFVTKKAPFGDWFDHSLGYWAHRNDENVEFVTFEEMKKDLRSVIKRLEKFLGLSITEEGMGRILEHSSLDGMKKMYAKIEQDHPNGKMHTRAMGILPFIQKGVSGGWKAQFTEEQRARLDQMTKERLAGTGLDVHYH